MNIGGVIMSKKQDKEKLKSIAEEINKSGGKIYYVGGCVRNKIIGIEDKDIDVEIHGLSVSDVKAILSKFGSVDEIGVSFGVLMIKGLDIDFTLPRTENKTGEKHTDFEVNVQPFIGLELASKRRDFTMNSIMEDILTGEIVDYNGGVEAIENKVIQLVDENTFIEDALRPIRASRFASQLTTDKDNPFTIHEDVINLSKKMDYSQLSSERVKSELDKILLSKYPSIGFNYLLKMNILKEWIPELVELVGIEQNSEHHPEGDVWNHTMLVLDEASKVKHFTNQPLYFMYASLLHDIGKPNSLSYDEKGVHSYGHHKIGADMIESIITKLTSEKNIVHHVRRLTYNHMKMHTVDTINDYKFRQIMVDCEMNDLLYLNKADVYGRSTDDKEKQEKMKFTTKFNRIERLSNGKFGEIKPFIQGKDLIKIGFKPGKEFGKLINDSFQRQLLGDKKEEIIQTLENKYIKLYLPDAYVSGSDLIKIGIPPNKYFKNWLELTNTYLKSGYSKEKALQNVETIFKKTLNDESKKV